MSIVANKLIKMGAKTIPTGYDFVDPQTGHTFIVMNTYDVNNQPTYEEWTDANYKTHRVMTRSRKIVGSFQVKFPRKEEYERFLSNFGNPEYSYRETMLTVFVNNTGTVEDGFFYIDYTTKDEIPYMDGGKEEELEGFTINITEA